MNMEEQQIEMKLAAKTQEQEILAYLETGASLTPLEALTKFGCFRLGARIFDLKAAGWEIVTTMVGTSTGKRVASYTLVSERDRAHRAFV
jgi:hypothetical protein